MKCQRTDHSLWYRVKEREKEKERKRTEEMEREIRLRGGCFIWSNGAKCSIESNQKWEKRNLNSRAIWKNQLQPNGDWVKIKHQMLAHSTFQLNTTNCDRELLRSWCNEKENLCLDFVSMKERQAACTTQSQPVYISLTNEFLFWYLYQMLFRLSGDLPLAALIC